MYTLTNLPRVPWLRCDAYNIKYGAKSQKIRGLLAADRVRQRLAYGVSCPHSKWYFVSAAAIIETHAKLEAPANLTNDIPPTCRYLLPHVDVTQVSAGDLTYSNIFVRPCPVKPRHGFVDSQRIKNWQGLLRIARATLEADPDGEILLTSYIYASRSAVLTPSTYSYGQGHEGATSGKSVTLYGPAPTKYFVKEITKMADIADGDVPYTELVYSNNGHVLIVQVRGGPEQGGNVDYVPRETKVRKVLTATEDIDLLVWEKLIAEVEVGTVVHAPNMSLANHFCVHAVIHEVPVLTSKVPAVGETLADIPAPVWNAKDYRRLAKAIRKADAYVNSHHASDAVARVAIAALHCSGAPSELTNSQARFLALGSVAAAKYLAAAVIGEARHAQSGSRDNTPHRRSARAVRAVHERCGRSAERNSFYSSSFNASIPALAHCLFALVPVFRERSWDNSYGGKKWAAINAGARALLNALSAFETKPCKGNWITVIEAWNLAIMREHNGKAPALSKWGLTKDYFDTAAKWPVSCLCGFPTGLTDYLIGHRVENASTDALVGVAPKYQRREKSAEHSRAVLIRRHRVLDGTLGVAIDHRFTHKKIAWISAESLGDNGKLIVRLSESIHNEYDTLDFNGNRYLPAKVSAKLKGVDVAPIPQAVRTLYKVLDVQTPLLVEELFTTRPDTLKVEGHDDIALDVTKIIKTLGEC